MDLLTTATSRDEADRGASIAVLPVGSFEQHGRHLPLITDTVVASAIARAVAERYGLLLLPPVTISCSHEHSGFAGTVSIRAQTLIQVVEDIAASLAQQRVRGLAVVNGHGGNYVLSNVVQQSNADGVRMALFPSKLDWQAAADAAGIETDRTADMHGGELETSLMLHVAPELVGQGYADEDVDTADRPHLLMLGVEGYSKTGIIGKPSLATAEKGQLVLATLVGAAEGHLSNLAPDR